MENDELMKIGIVFGLIANGCRGAMTGIDYHGRRKRKQLADNATNQLNSVATHLRSEITTTDGVAEENISAEQDCIVGEIIAKPMETMPRAIYDLNSVLTQKQLLPCRDASGNGCPMAGFDDAEQSILILHWRKTELIVGRTTDGDVRILSGNKTCARHMIGMTVRDEDHLWLKLMLDDETMTALPIGQCEEARIDDKAMSGLFIPNYVAKLLKVITIERFDVKCTHFLCMGV